MQAGKALEHLVAVIQEHLKSDPNARIVQNAKLLNRSGNIREIDVFVQTKANGENIGLAFACKDHKRKITEQTIDAFATKCRELTEIDKGIIVATSGYTKGAKKEAESQKIGLYLIDELPLDDIIPNYQCYGAKVIINPIWKELKAHLITNTDNVSFDPNEKIKYVENDKEVDLLKEIFNATHTTKALCQFAAKFMEMGKQAYKSTVTISPTSQLYINDVNNTRYLIDHFEIVIGVNVIIEPTQIASHKRYTKIDNDNIVSISEYNSKMTNNTWVIVESNDKQSSFFIKDQGHYYQPSIIISGKEKLQ